MELLLKDRLVFACDAPSVKLGNVSSAAGSLIDLMGGEVGWIKLNSAFVGGGHDLVWQVNRSGSHLWLDLKWHEVPDTVKNYTREAIVLRDKGVRVNMFSVHASGGLKMMQAAKDKPDILPPYAKPLVIAITVLTSLDQEQFEEIGYTGTIAEQVRRLARLAKKAGLDGVVASPLEAEMLRAEFGSGFLIVTPGIRFAEEAKGGQARVTTPKQAIINGADMIVMGSSLVKGGLKAVERAYAEINEGLETRRTIGE